MDTLLHAVQTINFYLSDYILVILLVGTGIFFSIRTRFVQVRCFGQGMRQVFGGFSLRGGRQKGGLSSFQALTTAIAAQVGTGNIIGACGAILVGGPGAIFWMWIIAFFGMATIYAEAVLAQETRVVQPDGSVAGGPVYYIKRAFRGKLGSFLAGFFAVAITLALGFIGCMVQSNSIGSTCSTAFGIPAWVIGLVVAAASAFVFLGGIQRVASVTEKLVPIMAILYLVGGLVLLILRLPYLPETVGMIFKYAFFPQAIIGGGLGYALKTAISQGVKRGLFSNEAGMGSTPHAHAMAKVASPHEQGIVAMVGVFIDTFLVLTMTALVVISTLYAGGGPLAGGAAQGIDKTNMAQLAFSSVFGTGVGRAFVALCLLFFAFSTILSWNFFGKLNVAWLFGEKATRVYSALAVVFIFLGSCLSNDLVWELSDLFNQLMVIPNALALLALAPLVAAAAKAGKK
ncbi:MAG: alanine/glycine:cation symporter family protein [Evtepia sp.]|uniref:alanine/glycine:cation symporter family protein n=1 Tax=Evtepia sp. TaxID=2773933 RepID=UPI0029844F03|nr:sodium:alanine symporter family protein [Evtepia sp.]MDD7289333.1 sodium:alanine symporter family protein [Clostridiales bacterium]MDY4430252.1 sodium:alanine symporter family protein [Evtepia sp.]